MKCKVTLSKIEDDGYASIYVFTLEDEKTSEYHKFWDKFENDESVQWDFDVIDERIGKIIANGAEDEHFRLEGKATKALPFELGTKLRLYCYRIDVKILIVGNGGKKLKNPDPKKNRTQDFPELFNYCETIRAVGLKLEELIKIGAITKKGNELDLKYPFEINIPDNAKSKEE